MRNKGAKAEYTKERIEDLLRAYKQYIATATHIYMPNVYASITNMPSRRFWVSTTRAYRVIIAMRRGEPILDGMRPTKREMYTEIYRRILEQQKKNPSDTLYFLCDKVVSQPAPKFYLEAGTVKYMIGKARKQWREERKKRLQPLLLYFS